MQLALITIVVNDYDEAIAWYTEKLGFHLVEDTRLTHHKRWVVIATEPPSATKILLAKAANADQQKIVGGQTGGRVFLFLNTDDFDRDYKTFTTRGVKFVRGPVNEPYGKVAVFADLYGNLWDLIEPAGN